VFGALSDNTTHPLGRRRPYMIAGVLGTSVVLLFFPGAQTVGALLGVYLGVQLFLNIANGPYQALLPDIIPPAYHGRASAFLGISQTLGRIGGAALAGYLVSRPNGLALLTWIFIVLLNALMLANVMLLKEKQHPHSDGVKETLRSLLRVPLRPYPNFILLLVSRVGIMMGVYTVTFCLLYYVSDTMKQGAKDAPMVVAKFMMLATVTGIFGTIPAGFISDRLPKTKVLFAANLICIVSGSMFAIARDLPMAYVAVGIFGVGFGIFAAVDWALACNLLPPGSPAKYLGIWSISDTLPQVIAPLIAGPLAAFIKQETPDIAYRVLMGLAVIYFALGTVVILFIKENEIARHPH
jgi:Na+/melibiose symporter-like transporter